MSVEKGNWLGKNQKEVDKKIQNLDSSGNLTGNVTGTIYASPINTYSTDGAIATTSSVAFLNATASTTQMTLADGTTSGQRMSIICAAASNTCDVDADFGGSITTITFTVAGQAVDLIYIAASGQSAWFVVGNNGATLS